MNGSYQKEFIRLLSLRNCKQWSMLSCRSLHMARRGALLWIHSHPYTLTIACSATGPCLEYLLKNGALIYHCVTMISYPRQMFWEYWSNSVNPIDHWACKLKYFARYRTWSCS